MPTRALSICCWHTVQLDIQCLGFLFPSSLKWFYAGISYWFSELADNLDCFLSIHNGASGTLNISCQFLRESPYSLPTSLCSIEVSFKIFFSWSSPCILNYFCFVNLAAKLFDLYKFIAVSTFVVKCAFHHDTIFFFIQFHVFSLKLQHVHVWCFWVFFSGTYLATPSFSTFLHYCFSVCFLWPVFNRCFWTLYFNRSYNSIHT